MAVELEKTPLWADIRKVLESSIKPVRYHYEATIHTVKDDFPLTQLVSLDIVRDYVNNIGDHIHLTGILPLGEYAHKLYPHRSNLEITIKRTLLNEVGNTTNVNTPQQPERYKAIFLVNENKNIKSGEYDQLDIETLNLMDILTLQLQLMDRSLEPLRIKTTSGTYSNVTQKKLIHSILGGESSRILVDGKPAIQGIDLCEPDNKEVKKHVIIPSGTHITSIPTFLHEKANGVYSAGIGTYLQSYNGKRLWFIYPLYDVKRFTDNVPKAIFYMVPQNRFTGIERTYRKEDIIVHILATSNKSYADSAEADLIDSGSGFRMAEARSFMGKPVEMTKDGPKAKRAQVNHESAVSSRDDGLNYAPVSKNGISSNPFLEYSKILKKNVARIDLVWENAAPGEIYPGMPCKYMFIENDVPMSLSGTIVFVHVTVQLSGTGITAKAHSTICHVTLLVEKIKKPK